MSDTLRLALVLLAAYPMPTGPEWVRPHCWIVPSLIDHMRRWNDAINPEGQRPFSGDYRLAYWSLIDNELHNAAEYLELVTLNTELEPLAATGTLQDAVYVADLLHACPQVLLTDGPAPPQPLSWRRLPSARPRILPDDLSRDAIATSR